MFGARYIQELVIKNMIRAIVGSPSDEIVLRLASLAERIAPWDVKDKVQMVRRLYEERHPSLMLTKKILSRLNRRCRNKFVENFVIKGLLENHTRRIEVEKEGGAPLFTVLISPSMRCNLRCKGCYAQNYKKKDDLPFEVMDRVISEAKDLGVAFFTILGGEPFIRSDIFDIFRKHNDTYFQVYTNGTLVNEKVAKKLVKVGNVTLNFSVEGMERETDERREKGVFKKVIAAMELSKRYGIPFGYSVCVTRHNVEVVTSDEFVDFMIEKGALIGWYFLYMPVCGDRTTELMPTPEQRDYLRKRRDYIRETKPIFIVDFWNDAPFVGGCIAGKQYVHINNYGDLEPCIFTHFSQVNIKDVPLAEALKYPFYRELRKIQPYDENLFLPCMLIDHPHVFRSLHKKYNLKPTHPGAEALVTTLKYDLDEYSRRVRRIYSRVWEEEKEKNVCFAGEVSSGDRDEKRYN